MRPPAPRRNFTNKNAHLAMFEQTTYLNGGANSSSPLYTTFTNLDAWTFCGVTRNVSSTVNGTVDSHRRLGGAPDGLAGAASMPSITAADCQMLEKLLVWWILSTHIEASLEERSSALNFLLLIPVPRRFPVPRHFSHSPLRRCLWHTSQVSSRADASQSVGCAARNGARV